jgi:hypothetical protein
MAGTAAAGGPFGAVQEMKAATSMYKASISSILPAHLGSELQVGGTDTRTGSNSKKERDGGTGWEGGVTKRVSKRTVHRATKFEV